LFGGGLSLRLEVIFNKSPLKEDSREIPAFTCADWYGLAGPRFRFTPLLEFMIVMRLMTGVDFSENSSLGHV
jgi:hypothetical protein